MRRYLVPLLVSILLGAAIHLDWHLARSTHHGALSFGWGAHWLLALPVFALIAWYAQRTPGTWRLGLLVIGLGVLFGVVLEPLVELLQGATIAWTFGPERLRAAAIYVLVGLVTYGLAYWGLRRRAGAAPSGAP